MRGIKEKKKMTSARFSILLMSLLFQVPGGGGLPATSNASPHHSGPGGRSIRGQIVIALYTYQGSECGDMSFNKGDQMEIIDDS